MVIVMNRNCRTWPAALLLISPLLPAAARAASLGEVKSVYIFPMSNGLDQYLANRITRDHVMQVVTDPKAADAVITDKLGAAFEAELLRLRPELKPPPPPKPKSDKDEDSDEATPAKEEQQVIVPVNTFRNARGTVFLVHAKSQQVVWSTYQKPVHRNPSDLERTAGKITQVLEKDLAPPVPGKK
jgi:hypothetical protein